MALHTVFTLGHSTLPAGRFLEVLQTYGIRSLVDIRTIPRSRHNPQYDRDTLSAFLAKHGIDYHHMPGLGGLRKPRADSPNGGWHNASFRGYADYMQTEDFTENLNALLAMSQQRRTAIMCAESVPWRCHRSLVSDALSVRHVPVEHIFSPTQAKPHTLTKFARVSGNGITYPPAQGQLL